MFKVKCEVWGGVTGHRVAFLKEGGVEREFASLQDAQKEAEAMMRARSMLNTAGMMNPDRASFSYQAVEVQS